MKLYSRSQIVKSSLISLAAGVVLTLSATAYISFQQKEQEQAKESEELASAKEESESSLETEAVEKKAEESVLAQIQPVIEEKTTSVAKGYDSAYTQDEEQNISVYEKCNEAVVNITTQVMGVNWFLEPVVQEGGSGSGSIIDKRGYVVTNVHVISNASKINISLYDGSSYEGTVIGKDVESDIAVIKFNPPDNISLKTIDYGDSNNLKVGQKVIAIGNPFALERTMTTGIISGLGRPIQESSNVIIRNMIQTDAAINPGNSGGPLLDTKGKMVGINTMIISNSGSSAGVGFAVPVSTARRVVDDLIKYRKVNRGILKIRPVQMTSSIARYAGLSINYGILVSEVEEGSSAAASGILGGTEPVQFGSRFNPTTIYLGGDIITGLDNISVRTYADYTSALESKRPGDSVTVTVFRNGEFKKLKVKLDGKETVSAARTGDLQEKGQPSML
ncbi:trypsin-like peptidase domain-containing protein [Treponema sp.]|uniref:S1C family serine protease n=1 Tax=Treponema sp. TaxID=166 RepID=UPI0025F4481A|nr:trypsin-like peptidase domain-containing protein [Treponema sp.]MBR4322829.1 trypsin-like peptidase domain-containing protein [Treponema sp.]